MALFPVFIQHHDGSGCRRIVVVRAYRLLILTLLLRPFGNLALALGMRRFSRPLAFDPLPYLQALLNPFVALGILMLILAVFTRLALLSVTDLSFVLPMTAAGYIISVMLGKFFLGEDVGSIRWLGTFLVFAGVALVSSTAAHSASRAK
jgi:drug/metabolite transporter (DMT)-like permease